MNRTVDLVKMLKDKVRTEQIIDISTRLNLVEKLDTLPAYLSHALYTLKKEGYTVYGMQTDHITENGKYLCLKCLAAPGLDSKEAAVFLKNLPIKKENLEK